MTSAVVIAAFQSYCATVVKSDNTVDLNLGSSWTNNVAPTNTDIALWDGTVTAANSVSLGADLEWLGLKVANPGGAVTLNAGNTLTLDGSGADLSAATQDLTLNCSLALGGSQTWPVAGGGTSPSAGAFPGPRC